MTYKKITKWILGHYKIDQYLHGYYRYIHLLGVMLRYAWLGGEVPHNDDQSERRYYDQQASRQDHVDDEHLMSKKIHQYERWDFLVI